MKKVLHILLLGSFIVTFMVPITGVHIHKMASLLFLLCSFIHVMLTRKKMNGKRWILLFCILFCFISGIYAMIFETSALYLVLHKSASLVLIFFLAIHIYRYHKKIFC